MRETIVEVVKYGLKGGSTMVVNIGLMSVLVELGGVRPELAAIGSTTAVVVIGYLLMHFWVFPSSDPDSHVRRGLTYYGIILGGKALNWLFFVMMIQFMPYPLAWVTGAVSVFVLLFTANRELFKEEVPA